MDQIQIVCAGCGAAYNAKADADFLQLNALKEPCVSEEWLATQPPRPPQFTTLAPVLHFCSTACLSKFVADDQNHGRIAWLETAKLPPMPEELTRVEAELEVRNLGDSREDRHELRRHWRPRLEAAYAWQHAHEGRLSCDFDHCIPPEVWEAERARHNIPKGMPFGMLTPVRPGPGLRFSSWSWGEGNPRGEHAFCCVACAVRFCEQCPFDAKDHWVNKGARCTHCQSVRNEDQGCRCGYTVCGATFCGAECALAHIEATPSAVTGWISREEAFPSEDRHYWTHNGCAHCLTEDDTTQFVTLDGPYDSTFDDERPTRACSSACVVHLLQKDVAFRVKHGIGKWTQRLAHASD